MNTNFWGPDGWALMHAIANNCRENNAAEQEVKDFFRVIQYLLPCKYCRKSLSEFYKSRPIDTTNRSKLTKWLYCIHADVNKKLRNQGQRVKKELRNQGQRVNKKLRNQGQRVKNEPSLTKTRENTYNNSPYLGRRFLGSIVYNYPTKGGSKVYKKRLKLLWMTVLPVIYPKRGMRTKIIAHVKRNPLTDSILQSRRGFSKWFSKTPLSFQSHRRENQYFEQYRAKCFNNTCL